MSEVPDSVDSSNSKLSEVPVSSDTLKVTESSQVLDASNASKSVDSVLSSAAGSVDVHQANQFILTIAENSSEIVHSSNSSEVVDSLVS